jgi:cytochrome c oxidase subunit 2
MRQNFWAVMCGKNGMLAAALAVLVLAMGGESFAQGLGQPVLSGLHFQDAATPIMEFITWFHDFVMVIITVIVLFVLALLIYVLVRFSEKANPVPSKTTHHVGLEVAWTVLPILILVAISIPSFRLLMTEQNPPKADLTLKITGKQWFWSWEYPDSGNFGFDQIRLSDEEIAAALKAGKTKAEVPRLLAVNNEVVVPVNKVVYVQVTAADVIHAFAVPSFGVKIDAVPGRLNRTWFKATKEGIYYGQCSELCGKEHAFMPLAIRVVSEDAYKVWLETAKKKYARIDQPTPAVAEASASVSTR